MSGQKPQICKPKIGLSACFFHADPTRAIFKGKTLVYLEQQLAQAVYTHGGLPWMITPLNLHNHQEQYELNEAAMLEMVAELDGLILSGGSDLAPQSYGEQPVRVEWSGDRKRDVYEMWLIQKFKEAGKPILGICRGAQLLNVFCGGTLYQDIELQHPEHKVHRNWDVYDRQSHAVKITPESWLHQIYSGSHSLENNVITVNSIHHQGIKDLGRDLHVDAYSIPDQIVEAFSWKGPSFMKGIQWHPEFIFKQTTPQFLDPKPIFASFMQAVQERL